MIPAANITPRMALLANAARRVALGDGVAPVVVADFGAAQGRNSMAPIGAAVTALRDRVGAERDISVVHTDLPDNDFSTLFRLLDDDPASYLRGQPNVFASAIGRSFYERQFPRASVTLGWSSNALHWLSHAPMPVPDSYHHRVSAIAGVHAAYEAQAAEDWRRFLALRTMELAPGGRLVVSVFTLSAEDEVGWAPLPRHMSATLAELVANATITQPEYEHMNVPSVFRLRTDLLAPFAAGADGVGLVVEQVYMLKAPDPIWDDFLKEGDAARFGQRWATLFRAVMGLSLARAVAPPRVALFMEGLQTGLAARFAAAPESMPMWTTQLVLANAG